MEHILLLRDLKNWFLVDIVIYAAASSFEALILLLSLCIEMNDPGARYAFLVASPW